MGFHPSNMLFVQSLLFQEMAALLFQFLRPQHLASSLTHFFSFHPTSPPYANPLDSIFKIYAESDSFSLLLPHLYFGVHMPS